MTRQTRAGGGGLTGRTGGGVPIDSLAAGSFGAKGFPFQEAAVSTLTGVATETFAEIRKKMARGAAWEMTPAGVAYSREGIEECLVLLGLAERTVAGALVSTGIDELDAILALAAGDVEKKAPEIVRARIVRFPPNRNMVYAKRLDDPKGPMVLIWVNKRGNFSPGMEVPIRPVPGRSWFELARKEPRFYGRW